MTRGAVSIAGLVLAGIVVDGCGGHSPTSPTPAGASPLVGGPASGGPLTSTEAFVMELPIAPADSTNVAYGIWPFGVHGGGHALDGHPGFDFEYRPGFPVLAVAGGVVDSVIPDSNGPDRLKVVQLRHARMGGNYLTTYTNLIEVPGRLAPGATVTVGEAVGVAGTLGSGAAAIGMIHFQVADPTFRDPEAGGTAIASPARYVSATARAALDAIWERAAYRAEWCEPFLTNSRANGFPMSRTWSLTSGLGTDPAQVTIRCGSDLADPEYTFLAADGTTLDTGVMVMGYATRPLTTADFRSASGRTRLAVYDIVEDTVRLAVATAGSTRPSSLSAAASYRTR